MENNKKTANNAEPREFGRIISYFSGVAKVQGLPHVFLHELLQNEKGDPVGIVIGFNEDYVSALLFSADSDFDKILFRSKQIFSISVSEKCLGRVFDGLGETIDGAAGPVGEMKRVFRQAPPIIDRKNVRRPLVCGIKIIDASLPIGRGQRELIIGDRKLGKSTLAVDTILNQKNAKPPVYCVYVICGEKRSYLDEVMSVFKKYGVFDYTIVVAATADDSLASGYLAPFVGCTMGEYFRDHGRDALIIYDDLSKHAEIYRSISLLLERPPGREAYPGDIFSLHAGLLERAAQLSDAKGGGSLTALPIIETQEGDITSFIPTNLISITDGQIYLENDLYQKGFLPPVNIGLSVSRVGSQAQPPLLKEVTGSLRLDLAQHKELEKLSQLETTMSEETKKRFHRGELLMELLKQEKRTNVSWQEQVFLFYAAEHGFFDDLEKNDWSRFEKFLLDLIRTRYKKLLADLSGDKLTEDFNEKVKIIVADFKKEFMQS